MMIPAWLPPAAVVVGFVLQAAALRLLPQPARLPACALGVLLALPAALYQHDALLTAVQLLLLPPLWLRLRGPRKPS